MSLVRAPYLSRRSVQEILDHLAAPSACGSHERALVAISDRCVSARRDFATALVKRSIVEPFGVGFLTAVARQPLSRERSVWEGCAECFAELGDKQADLSGGKGAAGLYQVNRQRPAFG